MACSSFQLALTITEWHDLAETIGAVATIAALCVGGIWSYRLFWKRRQIHPRAELSVQIDERRLPRKKLLIRVTATVKNVGDVLICLQRGYANLEVLAPCDRTFGDSLTDRQRTREVVENELAAPLLQKIKYVPDRACQIEPGESEDIRFDFIIDRNSFRLVQVYVYFSNVTSRNREIGWGKKALYEVRENPQQKKGANNMAAERDPRRDEIREQQQKEAELREKAHGSRDEFHNQHEPKPDPRPIDSYDVDQDDD